MDSESSYLDSSEGTRFEVTRKLGSFHLKEPKIHLQVRDTKPKSPEHPADVAEELSVNVSRRRPAQALFNFLQWPSVERISVVMHWPGFGVLKKGAVFDQPYPSPFFLKGRGLVLTDLALGSPCVESQKATESLLPETDSSGPDGHGAGGADTGHANPSGSWQE